MCYRTSLLLLQPLIDIFREVLIFFFAIDKVGGTQRSCAGLVKSLGAQLASAQERLHHKHAKRFAHHDDAAIRAGRRLLGERAGVQLNKTPYLPYMRCRARARLCVLGFFRFAR